MASGWNVYEAREVALRASRYYMLGRAARLGVAAASLLAIASSLLVLLLALTPLYRFQGIMLSGWIRLTGYQLALYDAPLRVPVLDSLVRLSFTLVLGPLLSTALVSLALASTIMSPKVPRVYLEAAAAGYAVAGLTVALLISFLRVLFRDIIPSIPLGGRLPTAYGVFTLRGSSGWYTDAGLLALRLWSLYPLLAALLIAAAAALVYYLARYYEDLLEEPLVYNTS